MKSKNNIESVNELGFDSRWRYSPDDKMLTGNEFDSATSEIESFFEGLTHSYGNREFIVIGDFHGERTHHVIVRGAGSEEGEPLSDIFKSWLAAPKRTNWRIVADFECDDNASNRSIIYCSEIFRV